MKDNIRWLVGLSLLMTGVLSVQTTAVVADVGPRQNQGQVRGEETATNDEPAVRANSAPMPVSLPPSPSLGIESTPTTQPTRISPSPSPSPDPSSNLGPSPSLSLTSALFQPAAPSASPTKTTKLKTHLIAENLIIKNQTKTFILPVLDPHKSWMLEIEYQLSSTEDALGFDRPGFTIQLDNQLVFQESPHNSQLDQTQLIRFNPLVFDSSHTQLKLWSGDTGDDQLATQAVVESIKLIQDDSRYAIETEVITDLTITTDTQHYLTLEWTSPQTTDSNLPQVLSYDFRYSTQLLTSSNWAQAESLTIILPTNFSPQKPGSRESVLVQAPPIEAGHIAIRTFDSTGQLSPLGMSMPFLLN